MKEKYTARDFYAGGQLSVYARLIRERKMTVEAVADMTSPEFAQQAEILSYSRQCVDNPWDFWDPNEEITFEVSLTWGQIRKCFEGVDFSTM